MRPLAEQRPFANRVLHLSSRQQGGSVAAQTMPRAAGSLR